MTFSLAQIAAYLNASNAGLAASSLAATGYSIDTRSLASGDLFFALVGENVDGHNYLQAAKDRGAVGAIVSRKLDVDLPQIQVSDVEQALTQLGKMARAQIVAPVVCVTGSAGKTSSKDATAHLLSVGGRVAKSEGNLNNHLGLPLSLLRMDRAANFVVQEAGMNHAGEILHLASIAKPNVGIVTNVGFAHIENFDSQQGVALAKRELVESLGPTGTAILNADDEWVRGFGAVHPGRSITFGIDQPADVRAEQLEFSPQGSQFRVGGRLVESSALGRHGVRNVLAGFAAGIALGLSLDAMIPKALSIPAGTMRGERMDHSGIILWNDCYNSNPDAAQAMVSLIADLPATRRIALLGEMLELGAWSESLHRKVGAFAAAHRFDFVFGVRGAAKFLVEAARENGLSAEQAEFFDEPEAAGRAVAKIAKSGDALLFKGSRGVKMERAFDAFLSEVRA
jgi:UDP-N-acetylmuramoyl-tripeptide--D-alanyl-D-alanine ligase